MGNNWRNGRLPAELICTLPDGSGRVYRIRAPGGWVVVGSWGCGDKNGNALALTLTLVPDEGHRWLGEDDGNE